jgi:hypothetical protein
VQQIGKKSDKGFTLLTFLQFYGNRRKGMKKLGWVLAFGLCLMLAGCMSRSRVADLTVMSSKNISSLEGAQNMGTFEGKDCRSMISGQMPNQEEALDRALEAGKGNAMIDAVIYFTPAPCLFASTCWEVKGTVIKTRDLLKKSELKSLAIEKGYARETLVSPDGREYLALKKRTDVDLNSDQKHYDLLLPIR